MPNFSGPLSASPDSLTITRRYFGFAIEMPAPRRGRSSQDTAIVFATETQSLQQVAYNQCVPARAATSPPKSPLARSMPSPSAKRTNPVTLIGATDLCLSLFDRLRHAFLVVEDEALIEQANFLVEGLQAPNSTIFSITLAGLPCALDLSVSTAFSRSMAADRVRTDRSPADWPRRHASPPCARRLSARRPCRPIRARRSRRSGRGRRSPNYARSSRPRLCRPKARRRGASVMFSPTLAIVSAIASAMVMLPALAARILSTFGPASSADIGDHLHQALKQIVARDKVGLRIDFDQTTPLLAP